jgi:ribosome-binding protein aMBF1 (putative translation factor)
MLEPTKAHPTKSIEILMIGPEANKVQAIDALLSLGFTEASGSIPWRDAFPDLSDDALVGHILSGARHKAGMSQKQLADLTGVHQRHISEMENCKRTIGKKNAKLFAKVLDTDYRVFL